MGALSKLKHVKTVLASQQLVVRKSAKLLYYLPALAAGQMIYTYLPAL